MASDMIDIDLEAQQVVQATPHTGAFFLLPHHGPIRSGNGSPGRGRRIRDARNGYPWASRQRGHESSVVDSVDWPWYQQRGTIGCLTG